MTYNSSLPLIVMKSCQIAPISTGSLNSPIRMFITEVSYRIQRCKSTYVFDKIPHRQFRILFFTNIDKTSDEKINRMIIAKCPFCCFSIITDTSYISEEVRNLLETNLALIFNFRYDGRHVFTRPQKASLKAKLAANKRF